jgi:hypothetical protein
MTLSDEVIGSLKKSFKKTYFFCQERLQKGFLTLEQLDSKPADGFGHARPFLDGQCHHRCVDV